MQARGYTNSWHGEPHHVALVLRKNIVPCKLFSCCEDDNIWNAGQGVHKLLASELHHVALVLRKNIVSCKLFSCCEDDNIYYYGDSI